MPKIIKKCLVCGKEFKTYREKQKACSQKCGSILAAKTMKEEGIYKKINKPTLGKTTCDYCGKEFRITDARHDKYCSIKCANQSNFKTTQCNRCGKEINYIKNKPEYCSVKCKAEDNPKVCSVCGKEFIDYGKGKVYCSSKCRREKARKELEEQAKEKHADKKIKCKECGKTFIKKYGDKRRKYCSNECQEKAYRKTPGYKAAKRRRRYKRRMRKNNGIVEKFSREEIFKRDNWTCQICGEPVDPSLEYPDLMSASIDHIVPLSKGGNHTKRNVQLAHFICNSRKSDGGTDQLRLFG